MKIPKFGIMFGHFPFPIPNVQKSFPLMPDSSAGWWSNPGPGTAVALHYITFYYSTLQYTTLHYWITLAIVAVAMMKG